MKAFYRSALAIALVVPMGIVMSGPAGAAGGTSCKTQVGKATITPGLSLVKHPQTIVATTTIGGCAGGGVTAGVGKATLKLASTDCLGLAKGGTKQTLTETITWNTKATSTIKGQSVSGTGAKATQATITGTVTAGLFAGSKMSTTIVFAVNKGQSCSKTSAIKGLTIKGLKPLVIK
jgi:hypothetical protein